MQNVNVEYDVETDTTLIKFVDYSDEEVRTMSTLNGEVYLNLHKETGKIVGIEVSGASTLLPESYWILASTHIDAPTEKEEFPAAQSV